MDMNMEKFLLDYPQFVLKGWSDGGKFSIGGDFKKVIIAGMGGSGVAGLILKQYLESIKSKTQVIVINDYELPNYILNQGKEDKESTLIICSSYSGNTEETVSLYKEAKKKLFTIVSLTSGGRLRELCEMNNTPCIILPKNYPPRVCAPYSFSLLLRIFQNMSLIENHDDEFLKVKRALDKSVYREVAKQLSEQVEGKIPLIYTSKVLSGVAIRWKQDINENSKTHCFTSIIPEHNHNEIQAFLKNIHPIHVIFLKDQSDDERIIKRMNVTKNIIKDSGTTVSEILVKGECLLARIFSAIYISGYLSFYLSKYYNINPLDVSIIENLKQQIK